MLETMTTAIQNNLWMNAIGMILVGLYCAIISYVMGIHLALFIDETLNKEPVMEEQVAFKEEEVEAALGLSTQQMSLSELEDLEPDVPIVVPLSQEEMISSNFGGNVEQIMGAKHRLENLEGATRVSEERLTSKTSEGEMAKWTLQSVDIVIFVLLICITVATSCGVAYETEHVWLRQIWLALLFGPFGCLCRWLLSRLNYQIEGNWKWFPLGTYIANMLAATIDFCLQAVLIRASPAYWGTLVINSIELGFCGCMSTVSTLITEVCFT
jgi:fluoride ion exporter CrcB/FEX